MKERKYQIKLEKVRGIAYIGVIISVAMLVGYIEALLPIPFGVPGMKLGLANAVALFVLYRMKPRKAWLVNTLRIVLVGFLFGNMIMMAFSMAGGTFGFLAMYLAKRFGKLSIYTVSLVGGAFHNIGQLLFAMIIMPSGFLLYYFPVLIGVGMITGLIIGLVTNEILKRFPIKKNEKQ